MRKTLIPKVSYLSGLAVCHAIFTTAKMWVMQEAPPVNERPARRQTQKMVTLYFVVGWVVQGFQTRGTTEKVKAGGKSFCDDTSWGPMNIWNRAMILSIVK